MQINRSHYTRYEQLHKARGGLAVAPVEDGVCVACNVKVSTSLIGEMRREEVVHCENCGRILYLVEKNKGNDVE